MGSWRSSQYLKPANSAALCVASICWFLNLAGTVITTEETSSSRTKLFSALSTSAESSSELNERIEFVIRVSCLREITRSHKLFIAYPVIRRPTNSYRPLSEVNTRGHCILLRITLNYPDLT